MQILPSHSFPPNTISKSHLQLYSTPSAVPSPHVCPITNRPTRSYLPSSTHNHLPISLQQSFPGNTTDSSPEKQRSFLETVYLDTTLLVLHFHPHPCRRIPVNSFPYFVLPYLQRMMNIFFSKFQPTSLLSSESHCTKPFCPLTHTFSKNGKLPFSTNPYWPIKQQQD